MEKQTLDFAATLGFVGYFSVCGPYAIMRYLVPVMEGYTNWAYSNKLPKREKSSLIGCINEELSSTKEAFKEDAKKSDSKLWKILHHDVF